MKAYIITFDKGGGPDRFNYAEFHRMLTTAQGVQSWWHYLQGTYIIIVEDDNTASNVAEYVRSIAKGKSFFTARIDLHDHDGLLNPDAWKWIDEQRGRT